MNRKTFAWGIIFIILAPVAYWLVSIWEDWYCHIYLGPCLTWPAFGAAMLFAIIGFIQIRAALGE